MLFSQSVLNAPYSYNATIAPTTAGTGVLVTSTTAGAIYITDLIISNGAAGGSILFGFGTGTAAPTTSAILLQSVYVGTNTTVYLLNLGVPFRVPNGSNFLFTSVSATTISLTANYYVAP